MVEKTTEMAGGAQNDTNVAPSSRKASSPDDPNRQPLVGILFSHIINIFIPANGGWDAFRGLTTQDVKEKFIQPCTRERKESYWNLIRRKHTADCGSTASVFISHAHQYLFLGTVVALAYRFGYANEDQRMEDPYIFMDIFSINQHRTIWSYEFLSTTFMESIKQFGHTIMVMSPWNDPLPYTRAWCIYEAYCTSVTDGRFEIAVDDEEKLLFLRAIKVNPRAEIDAMLATINAERSEASHEEERDRIHSIIRDSIGFAKLNELVFEQYRGWVIETTLTALKRCRDKISMEDADRLLAAGGSHRGQGSYSKAQLSMEHADLLLAVGMLYQGQANYSKAQLYLEESVDASKVAHGEFSREHLNSMSCLAQLYHTLGNFDKAELLLATCLAMRRHLLGETHPHTLHSSRCIADLYGSEGYYDRAEALLAHCLDGQRFRLGEDHPDTLSSINSLANIYLVQGKIDKAEKLFIDCCKRRKAILGRDHPSTLTSIDNLATMYKSLGYHDKAEPLLLDCLARRRVRMGEDHPDTLTSISNLASLYESQKGSYEKGKVGRRTHLLLLGVIMAEATSSHRLFLPCSIRPPFAPMSY